jgi:hypothetical protein
MLQTSPRYDPDRPLVFVHIVKTAGTSLIRAISEGLRIGHVGPGFDGLLFGAFNDFQSMAPEMQAVIWPSGHDFVRGDERFVASHMALSTFRAAYPDAQFITMMRKPEARAVSHWLHWRAIPVESLRPWGEGWAANVMISHQPLSDFLSSPRIAAQADNLALRTLLWPHPLIPNDGFIPHSHDDELIALARDRLHSLDFVGVVEQPFCGHLSAWLGTELRIRHDNAARALPENLRVDVKAEVSRSSDLLRERSRLDDVLWQISSRD